MKLVNLAAVLCVSVQISGCATPMTQPEQSAIGGGVVGAILGGIIGHAAGSSGTGALIGAALGLGGGFLVGKAIEGKWTEDARRNDVTESTKGESYKPEQGLTLTLLNADIAPTLVKPGDNVNAKVVYSLTAPTSEQNCTVIETRLLQKDGKELARDRKRIEKSRGEYESVYQFSLPSSVTVGRYTVVTMLELADGHPTAQQISHLNFVVDEKDASPIAVNP